MGTTATPRPGSPGGPLWDPGAIPAATVVVARDRTDGVEVLMLRRDRDLAFAGGAWVFPGGRIDPADHDDHRHEQQGHDDAHAELERAARRAAVREAAEEAGLRLEPSALHRWSHWTPPPEAPRRFSTAFFVTAVHDDHPVRVDGSEIREHRWQQPGDVLELHADGSVSLSPPTFITLTQLSALDSTARLSDGVGRGQEVEHFATRVASLDDAIVALYHGDAGYETGDATATGARHRLVMGTRWTYERSP